MFTHIAAGVASQKITETISEDHLRAHTDALCSIHQVLCEIKEVMDVITSNGNESDHLEIITLFPGQDHLINDYDLRHTALFAPTAALTITLSIPGLGNVAYALALGWNQLDFPSGTTCTAATQTTLIFRASNWGV